MLKRAGEHGAAVLRILQEGDGEQVLLTHKPMRVLMLIISSWLWVTLLRRKLLCACGCLSWQFLFLFSLKVSYPIKVIKVRLQDRNEKSFRWWAHWLCTHLHACGLQHWACTLIMDCISGSLMCWYPPVHQSSVQCARRWLLIQSITPCSEAASLSGNKVKLGVSALPYCSAFVTALQLVGASPPKSCPTENTVPESKGL